MEALSLFAVAAGAALVVAVALHVWYAVGLSRVFAGRGGEAWRAWIPLLNDAELFRLGRQDPVRAVLLVVPGVNVYGLVLKARAAHRLGQPSGHGAGTTALALVFPPVWAGLLARGAKTPDAAAAEVALDDVPADEAVFAEPSAPIAAVPGAASAVDAVGPAAPDADPAAAAPTTDAPLPVEAGVSTDPPRPAAAAGGRRAASAVQEPLRVPVLPGPVAIGASPAETTTVAPRGTTGHESHSVTESPFPAVSAPETHEGSSSDEPESLGRVAETTDATSERREEAASPAPVVDEATQTARPRSRRRGEWSLHLPGGERVSLESRTVVLGRRPASEDDGVQYVTVTDETRTMSKRHARLDWTVTGWTITDLDSTNGVTLVHDDGRAEKLGAGRASIVPTRFRLGDAPLELRPETTL